MEVRPRETVILADDFKTLVDWYHEVLGFEVSKLFEDGFHYANLITSTGIRIGIADAKEMGVEPGDRSRNTVVVQIEADSVQDLFAHLRARGATITSGPSQDADVGFWFGSFADPEGNPIWVVDKNCP